MRIAKLLMCVLVVSAALPPLPAAAEQGKKAAVVDFFLVSRLPRNALKGTVIPLGDNFFTAERLGLEKTLRVFFATELREYSTYDLIAPGKVEPAVPAAQDAFLYYAKGEKPENYFDVKKLGAIAAQLGADVLVVGLIQELQIKDETGNQDVKLKVAVLEFDAENGVFSSVKTYESESAKTTGYADTGMLPKRNGSVPRDIRTFADSETGRVFLGLLPDMLKGLPEGKETGPFLRDEGPPDGDR
jgi:hypothetical protein